MFKSKAESEVFYVVDSADNLLSRSACSRLGVLQFTGEVHEDVFGEAGLMKTAPISIRLREDAVPVALSTARHVPLPLMKPVEEELKIMEEQGIIVPETEPTDWVSALVPVPKNSGVRITVDYKKLNQAVKREIFPIPTLEHLTSKLAIPLDEASSKMTTFITPFGRKRFLRLPMGISLAPECFQRKMQEMLDGLPGVIVYMDDTLVFGDASNHDARLEAVIRRIHESGLKLNKTKCEFRRDEVKFLGMKISKNGIGVDDEKLEAIQQLQQPKNVTELRSLLGVVNYLCRFVPHIQERLRPLNDLLKKDAAWNWTPQQQQALDDVKAAVTSAPVLAFYDPVRETVKHDAIGAVLQEDVHNFCKRVFDDLPATPQRLVEISRAQQADELLQRVVQQTLSGWKEGAKHPDMLDYFAARGEISVLYLTSGTLLMYGRRIIIPPSLREEMLNRLHDDGHFGLNKCRQRAAESVWYLEIQRLPSLTSTAVIERLKRLFSRLGIPDLMTTDGGTQFTSSSFADFAASYGFTHRVTDPHTPSSNGAAERAQPAKKAWRHAKLRDGRRKKKQESTVNQRRGARNLPPLQPGPRVRIKTEKGSWSEPAIVTQRLSRRSYLVELGGCQYRRPGTARNRATGSTSATSGGAADIRGSTTPGGAATTTTAASASCAVA
ncbi:uncharacterized protein K02A2.6-like [Amphibalanus amphitrite]|uniref:uncharacterized protein K02A2.6-like n=1 Tax=Amphibalanus amphitrite TaxID=1232801 RepID=UPI001C9032CF|nr:uncharacterized protein K02A2.6-like [Amphibalanus amphitrite]